MSSAVQYPNQIQLPPMTDFLSKEEVALLKRTILKQFPEDEQESFVRHCQRTRLDPFTKQLYATRRYQKVKDENGNTKKVPTLVPVTGIHALTAVAERTGNYDGCEVFWKAKEGEWQSQWSTDEMPYMAKCIVYHKRHTHAEVGLAKWESFVGTQWNNEERKWEVTEFWARMGDYMLGKCAKAQALRGAFPDQLGDIYIGAELHGNVTEPETDSETIPLDDAKIMENRRREEEILASGKFQVVEQKPTGTKPTPAEMAEPADVHKLPEKPKTAPPPPATQAPTLPEAKPKFDDIDLSSPSTEVDIKEEVPAPWREHVIIGITNDRFRNRKIGDLNKNEIAVIENQWLPAIREKWDEATDAQREDAAHFESAIAYYKMAKPW